MSDLRHEGAHDPPLPYEMHGRAPDLDRATERPLRPLRGHALPHTTPPHRSARLADTPVVRRVDAWWLVAPSGALAAAHGSFTAQLDILARDLAAADRAVAELGTVRTATHGERP